MGYLKLKAIHICQLRHNPNTLVLKGYIPKCGQGLLNSTCPKTHWKGDFDNPLIEVHDKCLKIDWGEDFETLLIDRSPHRRHKFPNSIGQLITWRSPEIMQNRHMPKSILSLCKTSHHYPPKSILSLYLEGNPPTITLQINLSYEMKIWLSLHLTLKFPILYQHILLWSMYTDRLDHNIHHWFSLRQGFYDLKCPIYLRCNPKQICDWILKTSISCNWYLYIAW